MRVVIFAEKREKRLHQNGMKQGEYVGAKQAVPREEYNKHGSNLHKKESCDIFDRCNLYCSSSTST